MANATEAALSAKKQVLLQIIEMPYLYNKADKNYSNKTMRNEGYKVLLEIYKKMDKNATVKNVKKKIDNLRTTFLKELKKVIASRETGEGTYVPTLWYFQALNFLWSPAEPCFQTVDIQESSLSSTEEDVKPNFNQPGTSKKKKKKIGLISKQENPMDKANHSMTSKEDSFDLLGKSIGLQLRDLNKKQLTISRKLISDVIYYATLEKLNEDSYLVLGTPSVD